MLAFDQNNANAQQTRPTTRNTYGEVGLLDMPSARMAPDGQLSLSAGFVRNTQRYNLGFQILPWLEGSLRYSHIIDYPLNPSLFDRSFGLKMRLVQETDSWPEFSVGIRDLLGTGVYAGEYLTASKRLGDFDLTLGLGWGRLASERALANPFGVISSFKSREGQSADTGGTINFGSFFHGADIGLFGGASWDTPIRNLRLIAEYSSDKYVAEVAGGGFDRHIPFNFGLSYQAFQSVQISAGWFYGSSYGLTVSLNADPAQDQSYRVGPAPIAPVVRSDAQQSRAVWVLLQNRPQALGVAMGRRNTVRDNPKELALSQALLSQAGGVRDFEVVGSTLMVIAPDFAAGVRNCPRFAQIASNVRSDIDSVAISSSSDSEDNVSFCRVNRPRNGTSPIDYTGARVDLASSKIIKRVAAGQGLRVVALQIGSSDTWVYYENNRYYSEAVAAGRIARILMANTPTDVEVFHIIILKSGMPSREVAITRTALERAVKTRGTAAEFGSAISLSTPPMDNPILDAAYEREWRPRFFWSLNPTLRQRVFDPDAPLQIQAYLLGRTGVELLPGLTTDISLEANIWNNLNFKSGSNSTLPHVRSDVIEYYRQGINGIRDFKITYDRRLGPSLYGEVKAGYLEEMFAGIGGQLLWRPDDSNLAIGVNLYQVWQRSFNRLLGIQPYQVLTGHASVYYQWEPQNLNFAVHVGRYLAGDFGATFQVTRRFSTGVEVGAFATFTNVPFSKFGEGSFDKGIVIRIPLEWFVPVHTQPVYSLDLHSLTRDGGQMLGGADSLHDKLMSTSFVEMDTHRNELLWP